MVRERLLKLGLSIVALAIALAAALPTVAYAANTTPTSFNLQIPASQGVGSTDHTPFSNKIDSTPSYAIATQYSAHAIVGVSGINGYTLAVTNRTTNTYAYFRAVNQASTIYNTVHQQGDFAAWLWLYKPQSASGSAVYAMGSWSPDSLSTYTVINNGY